MLFLDLFQWKSQHEKLRPRLRRYNCLPIGLNARAVNRAFACLLAASHCFENVKEWLKPQKASNLIKSDGEFQLTSEAFFAQLKAENLSEKLLRKIPKIFRKMKICFAKWKFVSGIYRSNPNPSNANPSHPISLRNVIQYCTRNYLVHWVAVGERADVLQLRSCREFVTDFVHDEVCKVFHALRRSTHANELRTRRRVNFILRAWWSEKLASQGLNWKLLVMRASKLQELQSSPQLTCKPFHQFKTRKLTLTSPNISSKSWLPLPNAKWYRMSWSISSMFGFLNFTVPSLYLKRKENRNFMNKIVQNIFFSSNNTTFSNQLAIKNKMLRQQITVWRREAPSMFTQP